MTTKDTHPTNNYILMQEGSFLFMLIAVLVLIYQVFMIDRYDITALKRVHRMEGIGGEEGMYEGMYEGMEGEVPDLNPGANRASGGVSTSQWQAGGLSLDTSGSAGAGQLANVGNISGFFGGSEAPVFYSSGAAGPMTFGRDYAGYPIKVPRKPRVGVRKPRAGVRNPRAGAKGRQGMEGMFVPVNEGLYDGTYEGLDEGLDEGLWQQTGY